MSFNVSREKQRLWIFHAPSLIPSSLDSNTLLSVPLLIEYLTRKRGNNNALMKRAFFFFFLSFSSNNETET